jgi:hypothetical protein
MKHLDESIKGFQNVKTKFYSPRRKTFEAYLEIYASVKGSPHCDIGLGKGAHLM